MAAMDQRGGKFADSWMHFPSPTFCPPLAVDLIEVASSRGSGERHLGTVWLAASDYKEAKLRTLMPRAPLAATYPMVSKTKVTWTQMGYPPPWRIQGIFHN